MIKQLDKQLINKIAAGEVVERPLSVVKELTENSIDAGATALTVEIKEGGLELIRITDNGSGIPADQVDLAFAQHATSKIVDISDLDDIATLGFRGEALASISSVSHMEMITKTAGALMGCRIELHGGTAVARQELGCAEGTTINVSNLFYNTPARLKFLKKPSAEASYVTDLMQRLALGYPNLAFRYISNGQSLIVTNGNGDLKTAIYHIYGMEAAKGLIAVEDDGFVSGYIGRPQVARGSRSAENFFINGRYIKSQLLQNAVEDAYKSRLMVGKFPLFVLHLQVPAGQVDVNVHPAKMEVRFADEQDVYSRAREAIEKALSKSELIPEIKPKPTVRRPIQPPTETVEIPSLFDTREEIKQFEKVFRPGPKPSLSFAERDDDIPKPPPREEFTIIAQVFSTYWIAVRESDLFLIDQHAAHERVIYEDLCEKLENEAPVAQTLLEPQLLQLSPKEVEAAKAHQNMFYGFGFEFEISDDELKLTALPSIIDSAASFTEILARLEQRGESTPAAMVKERLIMSACKSAVKGKENLSNLEARELIKRMLALDDPYHCPHGRPTIVKLSKQEIEWMFKRT